MMSVPSYSRQRSRAGRQDSAFVKLNGKRIHLGVYDSPESREKYKALIAEYLRPSEPEKPSPPEGPATVNRLLVAFLKNAEKVYVGRDGKPTREYGHFRTVPEILRHYAGRERASDFGPKRLKEIRDAMVDRGWYREKVNKQVNRVARILSGLFQRSWYPKRYIDP